MSQNPSRPRLQILKCQEAPLTCNSCHAPKTLSELKHSLCSNCFPKISVREVKSLLSPLESQINKDEQMTRCVECNEVKSNESFTYNLRDKGNKICTHCKNHFKCIICNVETPITLLSSKQLQNKRSTWRCTPCQKMKKLRPMKTCVACNIQKKGSQFSKSEFEKEESTCNNCTTYICILCNEEKPTHMYTKAERSKEKSTCKPCKERKRSHFLSTCNNCRTTYTCILCNEEKPVHMYSNKEQLKEKRTCKPCKERAIIPKKKCLACNIEGTRKMFSKSEWKKAKGTCKACVPSQGMKKCMDCNIEKLRNNFYKGEWKKEVSTCIVCVQAQTVQTKTCHECNIVKVYTRFFESEWRKENSICRKCAEAQTKKCMYCNVEKVRILFSNSEWEKEKSKCRDCYSNEEREKGNSSCRPCKEKRVMHKKICYECYIEKPWGHFGLEWNKKKSKCKDCIHGRTRTRKRPREDVEMGRTPKVMKKNTSDEKDDRNSIISTSQGLSLGICDRKDDAVLSIEQNDGFDNKDIQKRANAAEVHIHNQNERWKKLEEENHEYAKREEETRIYLTRLEQENNEYKMKAKLQSKRIKQLEEEKTLLKRKLEKLEGIQDLSDRLKAELECPICLDPFDNPYTNPECGHRFCYRCIQQAINKSGKECPLCRVKITSKRGLRKDELIGSITNVVFRDDDECIEIN